MRNRLSGRRPSPSLVISILALVMAMAGTATAAKVLITSSSQIKAGAVNGGDIKDASVAARDLKPNVVTGDKVRNGSVGIDDLDGSARRALEDAGTQALEAFRKEGPESQEPDKMVRVATLSAMPPGTYAVFATTIITPDPSSAGLLQQGETVSAHCVLGTGGDRADGRAFLGSPGALSPGTVTVQITHAFSNSGSATLDCATTPTRWRASDTSIIALRLGRAPRTPVDG